MFFIQFSKKLLTCVITSSAMSAIWLSPLAISLIQSTSERTSAGSVDMMPCMLWMMDGTIAAISRTIMPTKNSSAPAIASPLDIFFAFFSLFIFPLNRENNFPSMSFINGFRRYATTSPIMTGCKIYVSFFQKSVNPL